MIGVLLRLRQHPIAAVAHIKGMLSQVLVEEEYCDALRCLWFAESDLEEAGQGILNVVSFIWGKVVSMLCSLSLEESGKDKHTGADEETI